MLAFIKKSLAAGLAISIGGLAFLSVRGGPIGSILFSIGLITVCLFELNLFTGKLPYLFVNDKKFALELVLMLLLNAAAAIGIGFAVRYIEQPVIEYAKEISAAKLSKSTVAIALSSVFCNLLIYIAVEAWKRFRNVIGITVIVLCVTVFILIGAEHCIADLFYFSVSGLLFTKCGLGFMLFCIAGNLLGGMLGHFLLGKQGEE